MGVRSLIGSSSSFGRSVARARATVCTRSSRSTSLIRSCRRASSSPARTATSRWASTGPVSTPASTTCTVAPGHRHAGGQGVADGVRPGEGRQQRGMGVDQPAAERVEHGRADDLHEAGGDDQVGLDTRRARPPARGPRRPRSGWSGSGAHEGRQAPAAGVLEARGVAGRCRRRRRPPGRPGRRSRPAGPRTATRSRTAGRRSGPARWAALRTRPPTLARGSAPASGGRPSAERPPAGDGRRDRRGDPALRGHRDAGRQRPGARPGPAPPSPSEPPATQTRTPLTTPSSTPASEPGQPGDDRSAVLVAEPAADRPPRRRVRRSPAPPATRRRSAARPGCRAARPAAGRAGTAPSVTPCTDTRVPEPTKKPGPAASPSTAAAAFGSSSTPRPSRPSAPGGRAAEGAGEGRVPVGVGRPARRRRRRCTAPAR